MPTILKPLHKQFPVLLLCLFSCSPHLFAGDDWQPIDPADLKETSEPGQPNADAVILYREHRQDVLKGEYVIYFRIKILTQKGKEKWSDVEIPYDRKYAKVKDIKARTIKPDGTIVPFEGNALDQTLIKGRHIKVQARVFTMPQVDVGSVIEYRYKVEEKKCCLLREWIVQTELYQRKASFNFHFGRIVGRFVYAAYLPHGYSPPRSGESDYDAVIEHVPPLENEAHMPPADQIAYRVRFFYVEPKQENFWPKVEKIWEKDVNEFGAHSQRVKEVVATIVAPDDSPEEKARKIYDAIQQMQNLSSMQAQTEAENKRDKPPDDADQVLQQKRGFSNQLARLYVVMARAAGLHAYLMRVSARDRWLFEKKFLDAEQLDTEIVIVKIAGKEVYLDPGTKFCPFGLLDWPNTGVDGIREMDDSVNFGKNEHEVFFDQTPSARYTANKTERVASLRLSEEGALSGTITIWFYGADAIQHRQEALEKDEQERAKSLEEELKKILPEGATVKLDTMLYQDDLSKPFAVSFDIVVPNYATINGKRGFLPAILLHDDDTTVFTHATRLTPIYFQYPYYDIDRIRIELPQTMMPEDVPEVKTEKREYSFYTVAVNSDQQVLSIHREFAMNGVGFPAKSYPDLKAFYEQVRTGDGQQIVLRTAAASASAGSGSTN